MEIGQAVGVVVSFEPMAIDVAGGVEDAELGECTPEAVNEFRGVDPGHNDIREEKVGGGSMAAAKVRASSPSAAVTTS